MSLSLSLTRTHTLSLSLSHTHTNTHTQAARTLLAAEARLHRADHPPGTKFPETVKSDGARHMGGTVVVEGGERERETIVLL